MKGNSKRRAAAKATIKLSLALITICLATSNCTASIEGLIKRCNSGSEKSCDKLDNMLLQVGARSVNKEIIDSITNQNLLAEIAKNDRVEVEMRLRAVSRVTSTKHLAAIIISTKIYTKTERVFVKPIYRNQENYALASKLFCDQADIEIALEALSRLDDPQLLKDVVLSVPWEVIQNKAIDRITDQSTLCSIVLALPNRNEEIQYGVRMHAQDRIFDQECLTRIVINDNGYHSTGRKQALDLIEDQDLILNIAQRARDRSRYSNIRSLAIEKLESQTDLASFALYDKNLGVRIKAIEKLEDQLVLAEIATSDSPREVRVVAINRLLDQSVLSDLATNEPEWQLREAATRKLTNQLVLAQIAVNDSNNHVAKAAFEKIDDQAVLLNLVANYSDWKFLADAFMMLNNESTVTLSAMTTDIVLKLAISIRNESFDWGNLSVIESESMYNIDQLHRAAVVSDSVSKFNRLINRLCRKHITAGDTNKIKEMIEYLNSFNDKALAVLFINCGQNNLEVAGYKWAHSHGYQTTTEYGGVGVRWGSHTRK